MLARDVMTTGVVTVSGDTSVQTIAQLLIDHAISGVPVVDDNMKVLGIISEGDLLHRVELGTAKRRTGWLKLFASPATIADDFVKSHARTAKDVMTTGVVSVKEDTPVAEIAALLESHGIKRVPVLRDGRLVGVVSRANLVRALASVGPAAVAVTDSDRAIRASLLDEIRQKQLAISGNFTVAASDGVVDLWGYVMSDEERAALRVAAENTTGVKRVRDHLRVTPAFPMI